MAEFDEWYEKEALNGWVDKDWMTVAFEAGQQSQQAKIDKALKQLDLAYPESWGCCVEQAINILKGNKDEN